MKSLPHPSATRLGRFLERFRHRPPLGFVRFGSFRRLRPISSSWGSDRGDAIDRYYIEEFLSSHATDIHGHVMEVQSDDYMRKFGGSRITESEVLHVVAGNPKATIVADLSAPDLIPSNQFDCIVLTQTLQMIYDVRAVVRNLHRILKPGGVVLMTSHGISKLDLKWRDQWRMTSYSARRLFAEVFPDRSLEVQAHGNVLVAIASLHGLAYHELRKQELDFFDPAYEVLVTVRAVKPRIEDQEPS